MKTAYGRQRAQILRFAKNPGKGMMSVLLVDVDK